MSKSMCHTHIRRVTCDRGPYSPSSSNFLGPSLCWLPVLNWRKTAPAKDLPCWQHWGYRGDPWGPLWKMVTTLARFPFQGVYTQQLPGYLRSLEGLCL